MTEFDVESQILPEYSLSEYRDWYNQKVKINPESDLSYFISLFDWYWMGNTYMSLSEKIEMLKKTHKLYKDVFENGELKRLQPLFKLMIQLSKEELGPQFEVVNNKAEFDQQFIEQHVFFDDCFFEQKTFNIKYFDEFNKFISGSLDRLKLYIYSQKLIRSTIIEFGKYVNEYIIITDPSIPQYKCNIICPLCDTRTQIQISDLIYHMEHPETSLNISKHNNCECDQFFKVCVYGQSQQVFGLSMLDLEEFEKKQASVFNKKEPITGGVGLNAVDNDKTIENYRIQVQQISDDYINRFRHRYTIEQEIEFYKNSFDTLKKIYNNTMNIYQVDQKNNIQQLIHNIYDTTYSLFDLYVFKLQKLVNDDKIDDTQKELGYNKYNGVLTIGENMLKQFLKNYVGNDTDLKKYIENSLQNLYKIRQYRDFRKMLQNVTINDNFNTQLSLLQSIQRDNRLQNGLFNHIIDLILPINLQNPYDTSNVQLQGVQDEQNYLNDQRWLYFSSIPVHWKDDIGYYYPINVSQYVVLNFGKLLNEIISYIVDEINNSFNINYNAKDGFPFCKIDIPLTVNEVNENRIQVRCKIDDTEFVINDKKSRNVVVAQRIQDANYILEIEMYSHIKEYQDIELQQQQYIEMKIKDLNLIRQDQNKTNVNDTLTVLDGQHDKYGNLHNLLISYLTGHMYFVLKQHVYRKDYRVQSIYTLHGMLQYNILYNQNNNLKYLYIFPTKLHNYQDQNNFCLDNNVKTVSIYIKYLLLVKIIYKQQQQYNNKTYNPSWIQFKQIMQIMQIAATVIDMNKIFIEIRSKGGKMIDDTYKVRKILEQLRNLDLANIYQQHQQLLYKLFYQLFLACYIKSQTLKEYLNRLEHQFNEQCFVKLRNSIELIVKKVIVDVVNNCDDSKQMVYMDLPIYNNYIYKQIQQKDNYFNNDIYAKDNQWVKYCFNTSTFIDQFQEILTQIIQKFDDELKDTWKNNQNHI